MNYLFYSVILFGIIIISESFLDRDEYDLSTECDEGWKDSPYGNSYKIVPLNIKRNWAQAQEWCERCGASLPWPQSKDEMFWLHGWISNAGFSRDSQGSNELRYWLAGYSTGNRTHPEFKWKTAGNAPDVKVTYSMWTQTDPNDYINEDTCIHYWGNGGYWAETRCSQRYSIICQKSPTTNSVVRQEPSTTTPRTGCKKRRGVCAGFCKVLHKACGIKINGKCWCQLNGERFLAEFNP